MCLECLVYWVLVYRYFVIFSQDEEFLNVLKNELNSTGSNMIHVSVLVVKNVSYIKSVQEVCVSVESKKNFLKRAIEKGVIFEKNPGIESVITEMFGNRFSDKDGIIQFKREMYMSKMKLDVKSLEKEMTALNCIVSSQKRLLKNITSDTVFKICLDFLTSMKASSLIRIGKENEVLWKSAIMENDERIESLEKWEKFITSITTRVGQPVVKEFSMVNSLKITDIEQINIAPDHGGLFDGDDFGDEEFDRRMFDQTTEFNGQIVDNETGMDEQMVEQATRNSPMENATKLDAQMTEQTSRNSSAKNDELITSDESLTNVQANIIEEVTANATADTNGFLSDINSSSDDEVNVQDSRGKGGIGKSFSGRDEGNGSRARLRPYGVRRDVSGKRVFRSDGNPFSRKGGDSCQQWRPDWHVENRGKFKGQYRSRRYDY